MAFAFNTCCTDRSFDSPEWMEVYREFHRDLRLPKRLDPTWVGPSIFGWYGTTIWSGHPERVGREWCAPANLRETHKIWEYVQVLGALRYGFGDLRGKRILSLGAGIESPLWTLARLGADVVATDTYFERRYWHPEQVPSIRAGARVFCPYGECPPVRFVNLNLRFRSLRSLFTWARLGDFDVGYSISSLEHVHGTNRQGPPEGVPRIFARKLRMFRKLVGKLRHGGVFAFTTEVITACDAIRRLDFYTRSEIEAIVDDLGREGLELLGPVDWSAVGEQDLPTKGVPGARHTALSLAFKRVR